MSLVMLVVLAAVTWAIVYAVRSRSSRSDDGRPEEHSALQVLEARFARGEIDEEEFRERRNTIIGR